MTENSNKPLTALDGINLGNPTKPLTEEDRMNINPMNSVFKNNTIDSSETQPYVPTELLEYIYGGNPSGRIYYPTDTVSFTRLIEYFNTEPHKTQLQNMTSIEAMMKYTFGDDWDKIDTKIYTEEEKSKNFQKWKDEQLLNKPQVKKIVEALERRKGQNINDDTHLSTSKDIESGKIVDETPVPFTPYEQEYMNISGYLRDIFLQKNKDYGSSVQKSYNRYESYGKGEGLKYCVGRLGDKMSRIENIAFNHSNNVKDETVEDTLLDLANYCILTVISYRENKK